MIRSFSEPGSDAAPPRGSALRKRLPAPAAQKDFSHPFFTSQFFFTKLPLATLPFSPAGGNGPPQTIAEVTSRQGETVPKAGGGLAPPQDPDGDGPRAASGAGRSPPPAHPGRADQRAAHDQAGRRPPRREAQQALLPRRGAGAGRADPTEGNAAEARGGGAVLP